jgi:tetratricopeptide (TPR) repeat protein
VRGAALVLLLLAFAGGALADVSVAVETYTRALETEDRASRLAAFREAERLFERAVAGGARNAELYTNLGNAALQGEHLGRAVLAYRRALRLDPDHPRALQNLEHARGLLPEWVPRREPVGLAGSLFVWHTTLARQERALVASLCFLVGGVLIACGVRFQQSAFRNAAWLPGLLCLAFVASLLIDREAAAGEAVVVAEEALLRVADSPLAPAALPRPLPAGAELRVLEARPPWLRVRLANGRDAWLGDDAVARIDTLF